MTIGRPIKPIELDREVKEHLQSITRSPRWKTGLKTLIFVTIKSLKSSEKLNWENIVRFIADMQSIEFNESNDFIKKLKENMNLVYFSKFSKCLPDHLIAEALSERSFDFHGLVSEIQNNKIEVIKA